MNLASIKPYRQALYDFYNGDTSAKIVIHREDGLKEYHPISTYFLHPSNFSELDQTAIDLCRGSVLDIGAGAGRHSLALQALGFKVCAIDISPEAVDIMIKRGVKDARRADIFNFDEKPFDTLLMLMHGVGIAENLAGLDRLLNRTRRLVKPEGRILLDSFDLHRTNNPVNQAYQNFICRTGRYRGEIRFQFEYNGEKGPWMEWLQIDPQTLASHAMKARFCCKIVYKEKKGDYLAQLLPSAQ
ncbi:MAG TPA: class I SAM-dependent methyltransferase [Desulfobacterales bacterium]|nr:class I SAM-dependent methyltransferase [Desulfobacterales bacterium]